MEARLICGEKFMIGILLALAVSGVWRAGIGCPVARFVGEKAAQVDYSDLCRGGDADHPILYEYKLV